MKKLSLMCFMGFTKGLIMSCMALVAKSNTNNR